MIAATLALYVTVYLALILAYVTVIKYMAEKPHEVLATETLEEAATPPGAITPPPLADAAAGRTGSAA